MCCAPNATNDGIRSNTRTVPEGAAAVDEPRPRHLASLRLTLVPQPPRWPLAAGRFSSALPRPRGRVAAHLDCRCMVESTPETVQRLAVIRLLLSRAEEESYQAPPFCWDSLNGLHDVVEMFLLLGAEVLEAKVTDRMPFLQYWDALSEKMDGPLGYRNQMRRVNHARVGFKHHGNVPSSRTLEEARTWVHAFIYDETPRVFGMELDDVSLASFIASSEARQWLQSADCHWPDDPSTAFAGLYSAFDALIEDYAETKDGFVGRAPSWEGLRSAVEHLKRQRRGNAREDPKLQVIESLRSYDRAVEGSLLSLQSGLRIVAMGVDLRRHARFRALTPDVSRRASGGRTWTHPAGMVRTQEEFEFCRDFVVTTALRLAEFDYGPPRRDPDSGHGVVLRRD